MVANIAIEVRTATRADAYFAQIEAKSVHLAGIAEPFIERGSAADLDDPGRAIFDVLRMLRRQRLADGHSGELLSKDHRIGKSTAKISVLPNKKCWNPGTGLAQTRPGFAPIDRNAELKSLFCIGQFGRGERIRTSDSCVPNAVLYQAELHPDGLRICNLRASATDVARRFNAVARLRRRPSLTKIVCTLNRPMHLNLSRRFPLHDAPVPARTAARHFRVSL